MFKRGGITKQVCVPKMRFRLKIEKFVYLKWGFALSQKIFKRGGITKKVCVPKMRFRRKIEKFVYLKSGLAENAENQLLLSI